MAYRFYTSANPCPVCSGHSRAGASGDQCTGGIDPAQPRVAWCSTRASSHPSQSGRTYRWQLPRRYEWKPEPKKLSRAAYSLNATLAPYDLEKEQGWRESARWDYYDQHLAYKFSVFRFDWDPAHGPCPRPRIKEYRPGRRCKGGHSRLVQFGLPAADRIPYALPRLLKAIHRGLPIYVVEGEKSADAINHPDPRLDRHAATTLPGGSAQWNSAPDPHGWFAGARDITVVVDRDTAGEGWARDVVHSLQNLEPAPRLTLVRSRTTAPGDDVVDHLAAGFSLAELEPFNPQSETPHAEAHRP